MNGFDTDDTLHFIILNIIYFIFNFMLDKLSNYGDILAIPFFGLLVVYFYKIKNKSFLEYVLFVFCMGGFFGDIFYTYLFLYKK